MTTHTFGVDGQFRSEGKNLAVLLSAAKTFDGVKRITVTKLERGRNQRGEALVTVEYMAGDAFAVTDFVSYEHARDWACGKSDRKATWFTGCIVADLTTGETLRRGERHVE